MKYIMIILAVLICIYTFSTIEFKEEELKEHIITQKTKTQRNKSSNEILNDDYHYTHIQERKEDGIYYDKVYSTFNEALKDASRLHMNEYQSYTSYTIDGINCTGYKIYFIK